MTRTPGFDPDGPLERSCGNENPHFEHPGEYSSNTVCPGADQHLAMSYLRRHLVSEHGQSDAFTGLTDAQALERHAALHTAPKHPEASLDHDMPRVLERMNEHLAANPIPSSERPQVIVCALALGDGLTDGDRAAIEQFAALLRDPELATDTNAALTRHGYPAAAPA